MYLLTYTETKHTKDGVTSCTKTIDANSFYSLDYRIESFHKHNRATELALSLGILYEDSEYIQFSNIKLYQAISGDIEAAKVTSLLEGADTYFENALADYRRLHPLYSDEETSLELLRDFSHTAPLVRM